MMGKKFEGIRLFGPCEACLPIEETRIIALLGIRFWDPVKDEQVGDDDLVVTAWPENGHGLPVRAFRTPSGVYAFRGLPGLRGFEYPGRNDPDGEQNTRHFVVKAEDTQQRFLTVAFCVEVPTGKGIFLDRKLATGSGSPPTLPGLPGLIFSKPTRAVFPGIAAIRAQLKEYSTGLDAAYAVIEVEVKGKRWYGLSDDQGSALILFPYPAPENLSPPKSAHIPLYKQKWGVIIRVYYEPAKLVYLPDKDLRLRGLNDRKLPELGSIFSQSPANIRTAMPGSPVAGLSVSDFSAELSYGKELVLKTGLAESPPQFMSELYIDTKWSQ